LLLLVTRLELLAQIARIFERVEVLEGIGPQLSFGPITIARLRLGN
jgi:hypothetical protein